jgi:hypothetical protein
MGDLPSDAAIQAATVERFIEGWKINSGEAWTELWADDCTNQILPYSLHLPPMRKADVIKSKHFTNVSNWEVSFKSDLPTATRATRKFIPNLPLTPHKATGPPSPPRHRTA